MGDYVLNQNYWLWAIKKSLIKGTYHRLTQFLYNSSTVRRNSFFRPAAWKWLLVCQRRHSPFQARSEFFVPQSMAPCESSKFDPSEKQQFRHCACRNHPKSLVPKSHRVHTFWAWKQPKRVIFEILNSSYFLISVQIKQHFQLCALR